MPLTSSVTVDSLAAMDSGKQSPATARTANILLRLIVKSFRRGLRASLYDESILQAIIENNSRSEPVTMEVSSV